MKNQKLSFKKNEIKAENLRSSGGVGGIVIIVLLGVAALAGLIALTVIFFINLDDIGVTLTMLTLGLVVIAAAMYFSLSMLLGKFHNHRKGNYFIVSQNRDKYRIVDELKEDNISLNDETEILSYKEQTIEKQHNKNVNLVKTFPDFAKNVNEFFAQSGYKTNVGYELVASLATSPLLFINKGDRNDVFLENINSCFNSPKLIVDQSANESIYNSYALFDAINTARSFKNSPVFLIITNLDATKASDFLEPFKKYFSHRNSATIFLSSNYVKIPNNLYIIVSLNQNSSIEDLDYELLKHSSTFNFDCQDIELDESANPKPIELGDFNIVYGLSRLKNEDYLSEDYWKKVDQIEALLVRQGYPAFDNHIISNIESYISIAINATKDQVYALDKALSNLVLIPALSKLGIKVFDKDDSIITLFDSLFDEDQMKQSKSLIDKFYTKASKESEDINQ